ncbi:MAG: sigma-54 dependent transcriptional regulator [Deltaproteobacteria bacterium]
MKKVLIVDDEEALRHMLSVLLKAEGYEVNAADGAKKALEALEGGDDPDFILSDVKMPGMNGLEFLNALRERRIERTVIMMSAYGTMDMALECMKLGAYDYVSKPFKTDEIILTIKKAEERERLKRENSRLREESLGEYDFKNIVTEDEKMLEVLSLVKKVADYPASVLVTGESGTGKELVARAIHYGGARAQKPFVAVNCGAIPAPLIESELFGHVKGAFTDAHRTRTGLFQEADGGTIFLDEVGDLPMELQVKLLRALQEGEIRRVGDAKPVKIDTRVVAATIKDLKEEIKKNRFREDLYYRLNVIEIKMPPLRARTGDIPVLAAHFVEKFARKFGKSVKGISHGAAAALKNYPWPGNVRELENVIERAMILEDGQTIGKESLPITAGEAAGFKTLLPDDMLSIKKAHEAVEKELIKKALLKTDNNRTKAAVLLDLSHRALLYKIKNYKLE